jgi:hypothetical protein
MTKGRWLDVSAAPRDGSPILLWIQDDEDPPNFPVTVGFWEANTIFEIGIWRVFSASGSSTYFDQHVRGWKPAASPQDCDKDLEKENSPCRGSTLTCRSKAK